MSSKMVTSKPIPMTYQEFFSNDMSPEDVGQLAETGGSIGIALLIFAAIFIGSLIMILMVFSVIQTKQYHGSQQPPPPPPSNPLNSTAGAGNLQSGWAYNGYDRRTKTNCESDGRGIWNISSCSCISPFWGTNCQNEGFSAGYAEVGTPIIGSGSGNDTHLDIIETIPADRLSFNYASNDDVQTLCTNYCDGNTGCIGVVWTQGDGISQGECTLISGVETNSIIPFNVENNIGPTIYIKLDRVKTHLRLPNRVVLLSDPAKLAADKFTFGLIYRYWINLRNNDMIIARRGDVRSLNFVPTGIINQSNLTGYYSLVPFTPADITNPDFNFYIQYPDQMLAIPSSWAGLVIYSMYI